MSKRIYQYPEVTELQEGDVMLIDKEGNESAKSILASKVAPALMSKTITERGVYKASDDGVRGYNEVDVDIPYTDIHVASGAIATFEGEDLPLKSLTVSIEPVQAGSGDPSPTNVRTISGWSACNVSVRGVNQWDEQWELGAIGSGTGQNVSATDRIRSKNYIQAKYATYYITTKLVARIACYDSDESFLGVVTNYVQRTNGYEFTTKENTCYIRFEMSNQYGTTYNNDISINYPSSDTTYHAYAGTTTTIPFVDGQGQSVEVFGGSVDVVNGGEQPNDGRLVDFSTASIMKNDVNNPNDYLYYIRNLPVDKNKPMICSHAPFLNSPPVGNTLGIAVSGSGSIYINLTSDVMTENTVEFLRQYCINNNVQIKYSTSTPTTFYTQPTSIKSLDGENNVFADTGEVDVEYQTVWVRPTE